MCVYTGRCVLQIRFIYKCDGLSTYPAPFQHLMDPSNVFDEVLILLCVLQNVQYLKENIVLVNVPLRLKSIKMNLHIRFSQLHIDKKRRENSIKKIVVI